MSEAGSEQIAALTKAIENLSGSGRQSVSSANIVIPLAAALSMIFAAVTYGNGAGRTETTLQALVAEVSAVRASITPLTADSIRMRADISGMAEKVEALRTDLKLLDDYTKGRIASLPYRKGRD